MRQQGWMFMSLGMAAGFLLFGLAMAAKAFLTLGADSSAVVTLVWTGMAGFAVIMVAYFIWIRDKSTSRIVQSIVWVGIVYGALFASQLLFRDAALLQELKIGTAAELGIPFDQRSVVEGLLESRADGDQTYAYIEPFEYLKRRSEVIPVGGISGVNTLMCNESGEFIYYLADRHGLNNPDELWNHQGSVDFVFLGDSFVHGVCVDREDNLVDRFRSVYPGSLNLGISDSGPGYYSFAFKSLMQGVEVKNVFLLFYEGNDLDNLVREFAHDDLRALITSAAPPIPDRALLDRELIDFHEAELLAAETVNDPSGTGLLDLILLREVTDRLRDKGRSFTKSALPEPPLADLEIVFTDLRDTVDNQGGELVIVYLPSYEGITGAPNACGAEGGCSRVKRDVVSLSADLGIDVVDVDAAFRSNPDPAAFFPFRLIGHYTPDGYQIVADEILAYVASH